PELPSTITQRAAPGCPRVRIAVTILRISALKLAMTTGECVGPKAYCHSLGLRIRASHDRRSRGSAVMLGLLRTAGAPVRPLDSASRDQTAIHLRHGQILQTQSELAPEPGSGSKGAEHRARPVDHRCVARSLCSERVSHHHWSQ